MKALVTGATGFLGSYVIETLLAKKVDVIATSTNLEKAQEKEWFPYVKFVVFDMQIADFDQNDYYLFFDKPDKIIHLAWGGLPNYKSLHHFEKELLTQYFLLKNLVRNGAMDILVTGTCFEYGLQEGCLSETTHTSPHNAYGLAKDTLRKALEELQKEFSFHCKWVRLFYMYGKGQSPNSLLSQLDNALERKDFSFNMSGGEQLRDYLPVERVAHYIVELSVNKEFSGIVNCCSGVPISVKQLVKNYLERREQNIHLNFGFYPYTDYEPMHFWGSNKKLIDILSN